MDGTINGVVNGVMAGGTFIAESKRDRGRNEVQMLNFLARIDKMW